MKSTFNFLMLALVSQAASLVISNECGSDASCMDIKDHKELKKRECKTFEKKEYAEYWCLWSRNQGYI